MLRDDSYIVHLFYELVCISWWHVAEAGSLTIENTSPQRKGEVMQLDSILEGMPPLQNDKLELQKQKKAVRHRLQCILRTRTTERAMLEYSTKRRPNFLLAKTTSDS